MFSASRALRLRATGTILDVAQVYLPKPDIPRRHILHFNPDQFAYRIEKRRRELEAVRRIVKSWQASTNSKKRRRPGLPTPAAPVKFLRCKSFGMEDIHQLAQASETLRSIDVVGHIWLPDSCMEVLPKLRHLEYLNLSGTLLGKRTFEYFPSLPALTRIEIRRMPYVDNDALAFIQQCKKLRFINASMTGVRPRPPLPPDLEQRNVEHSKDKKNSRVLCGVGEIPCGRIYYPDGALHGEDTSTTSDKTSLCKDQGKDCPEKDLSGYGARAASVPLEEFASAEDEDDKAWSYRWRLRGATQEPFCSPITDDGVKFIPIGPDSTIEGVDLRNIRSLTDESLDHLSRCPNLTHVFLSNCDGITDDGLRCLRKAKRLYHLHVTNCPNVTDQSLAYLSNLHELHQLDLWGTSISDEGLEYILLLRSLSQLNVPAEGITDAGIRRAKKMQGMLWITRIGAPQITWATKHGLVE